MVLREVLRMTEHSEGRPATTESVSHPRRWLERIKINRFRSIEPGTELRFSEGFHVVLGKNASGKSTLLDLIGASLTIDFDRPEFRDEPLDVEFALRAGELCFEATLKRVVRDANSSDMLGEAEELQRSMRDEGRYVVSAPSGLRVIVVLTSDDAPYRMVEGVDAPRYGLDEPLGRRHQLAPLAPGLGGLYNLWFEGSLKAGESMETLVGRDAFRIAGDEPFRMSEGDELLDELDDDHLFAILLGQSMRSYPYLLPRGLIKALSVTGSAIEVSLAFEPLLSAFVREMGFPEARMSLGPPRVERHVGQEVFAYSSPTFTFYRDGRLVRRIDQLSYGQRRLFALGWYLACTRDTAILDEPSNGLHESWIEFLVSQLHDRQVFLTSQNRELLDMLPFTTEAELSRGFILCESRPLPGGEEPTLHWRGIREDESALMIKALRASRVDLITDLLRVLDLW
jgi:energy-coupling factor transporter ATP-binding protein EcfA2